jgi:hypothetical protein
MGWIPRGGKSVSAIPHVFIALRATGDQVDIQSLDAYAAVNSEGSSVALGLK